MKDWRTCELHKGIICRYYDNILMVNMEGRCRCSDQLAHNRIAAVKASIQAVHVAAQYPEAELHLLADNQRPSKC